MSTSRERVQSPDADFVESLCSAMVEHMTEQGWLRSDEVATALLRVPREKFAPGSPLETVYAAEAVVITRRDEHGAPMSSVSAPRIQAMMLQQADLRPGMTVLEIGSGGYNAALIAELVGAGGEVTTVDIDAEVVDRARECLTAAGYEQVRVVIADAEHGVPEFAPYDRIIVTAGAWDIPPAWIDQLAEDGVIVVPLRMRGLAPPAHRPHSPRRTRPRARSRCGYWHSDHTWVQSHGPWPTSRPTSRRVAAEARLMVGKR